VTLPKNLITAPCRNVAVVVLEIPLPPSPVHAEIEGRRSAVASGQNSERVGDEVYVYSMFPATKTSPGVYDVNPLGFVLDHSMRGMGVNSIGGDYIHGPTTTLLGMRLSNRYTTSYGCHDLVERVNRHWGTHSCEQSKNKQEQV
jgi:hypothetical protein